MSIVKATKQKQKLLIDGHYFIKYKETKNTTSWCCDKKGTLKCTSIVKTHLVDGNYDVKDGPTEHNHEDPQNRKLIVATPRKSIVGKAKKISHKPAPIELDFEEKKPTTNEHDEKNPENKTIKKNISIPYVDQPIIPDFGVKEIKFIKWKEGKTEKLFVDGYYFSLARLGKKTCSWRCSNTKRGLLCHAIIITIYTSGAHKLKRSPDETPHNHDKTDIPYGLKHICNASVAPIIKEKHEYSSDAFKNHISNFSEKVNVLKKDQSTKTENMADVSMHTQLMCRIPQTDVVEFPPPIDCEIEFVILFGLRRQMMPEQIFYELQSIYGLDAPSFEIVSEYCRRFQAGYYPKNDSESRKSEYLMNLKNEIHDDLNVSKEFLTVQPDI